VWQATAGHLHVVVATHEHADHLSGFVQKGSPFLLKDRFTIDQLWVAWTKDSGDELADRLRRRRATARRIVERAVKTVTEKLRLTSKAFSLTAPKRPPKRR